jgi:hypothetical protein
MRSKADWARLPTEEEFPSADDESDDAASGSDGGGSDDGASCDDVEGDDMNPFERRKTESRSGKRPPRRRAATAGAALGSAMGSSLHAGDRTVFNSKVVGTEKSLAVPLIFLRIRCLPAKLPKNAPTISRFSFVAPNLIWSPSFRTSDRLQLRGWSDRWRGFFGA